MVKKVVFVLLLLLVAVALLPEILPVLWQTDTDMQAYNATGDAVGALAQTVWPVVILLVGLGIVIGLIVIVLRRFKVI